MSKTSSENQQIVQHRTRDLATKIERDINIGRLGVGAWLKQIDLEAEYECSRLDVRQALERLAERDIVELIPHRGYRVQTFSAQRLENILNIRAILEVGAIESIFEHVDAIDLDKLRELAQSFSDSLTNGTTNDQEETNRAFHAELLQCCPNRDLVKMIFDLRDRVPIGVRRESNTATMLAKSAQDHVDMITHLSNRDLPALLALVRRHVLGAMT
jgi:DNA-binding GntR family transcriptional regulator